MNRSSELKATDPSGRKRLRHLSTRRAPSRAGRFYSRFVRVSRLVFPLAALGIMAVIFAWPKMEMQRPEPLAPGLERARAGGVNELVNPRFESEDRTAQPYILTATRAVQSPQNPEVVLLDEPKASLKETGGVQTDLEAKKGMYRQAEDILLLDGDVRLQRDGLYHAQTERLSLHIKDQRAWSDRPVRAQGPEGTIEASGFRIEGGGALMIFTGPAKLVLYDAFGARR